jgi:hypothetical protein
LYATSQALSQTPAIGAAPRVFEPVSACVALVDFPDPRTPHAVRPIRAKQATANNDTSMKRPGRDMVRPSFEYAEQGRSH